MNMPGFNAIASLYRARRFYDVAGSLHPFDLHPEVPTSPTTDTSNTVSGRF